MSTRISRFISALLLAVLMSALGILAHSSTRTSRSKPEKPAIQSSARDAGKPTDLQSPPVVQPVQQADKEENEVDVKKREDWFLFQRRYPFDSIPNEARYRAWSAQVPEALSLTNAWQPIGPAPTTSAFPNNWGVTSGRINAIAISPANSQLVLIGAATGGIWRSTDGGVNFTPVSDSQGDLAVQSIAFSPSNSAIVYAGMGDDATGYLGLGVLKSTDSGQTWSHMGNNLPGPGLIAKIAVDPTNANRVYAAQSHRRGTFDSIIPGGFYLSTDGGVGWTKTLPGVPRDLVLNPANPQTLYLTMQEVDDGVGLPGLYRSTNGGSTWTRIYTSPYPGTIDIRVAVSPANSQVIYVYVGGLPSALLTTRVEVSTDGGASWTNRGSGTLDRGQFGYNTYIYADPANANTVYVGTRDIFKSVDSGVSWTNLTNNFTTSGTYTPQLSNTHPGQHALTFLPGNPNVIYIGNDGGLWKSPDGGTTFGTLNATLSLTMFVGYALHPTNPALAFGGTQSNGSQKRLGTTGQWREFVPGDGGNCVILPIAQWSDLIYTTVAGSGTIYRFTNDGEVFNSTVGSNSIFGEPDTNPRIAFYAPFTSQANILYFGTWRLFISYNIGYSWTAPAGTLDLTKGGDDVLTAIGAAPSNPDVVYTGSAQGRAMVSSNGGTSWTDITVGLPDRFIKSITVNPFDPANAYLTTSGFLAGHVFKTYDMGATWTDITGVLPDVPANALLIDPNNDFNIYVGTDIGIFRSTNSGNTWASFNHGLPPVIVQAISAQSNGVIQIATYGRGAYQIGGVMSGSTQGDFDGDSKIDLSIFRPSNGRWYTINSTNQLPQGTNFGISGDIIVPADYDGDGQTDIAVWRPSDGVWRILKSSNGSVSNSLWGVNGDVPVPGDYDGDGKADIAVFRPTEDNWYIIKSSDGTTSVVNWGINGDVPVPGDYDGDGKTDIAAFRPSNNTWYIIKSLNGAQRRVSWGVSGDKLVPADYDGDGKTDIAVWRPDAGWRILRSSDGLTSVTGWGINGDVPVPGDYDGDGKTDVAVWRPSNGTWFIRNSGNGSQTTRVWGVSGDVPVPSAYVR